jgi:hypothetical protein
MKKNAHWRQLLGQAGNFKAGVPSSSNRAVAVIVNSGVAIVKFDSCHIHHKLGPLFFFETSIHLSFFLYTMASPPPRKRKLSKLSKLHVNTDISDDDDDESNNGMFLLPSVYVMYCLLHCVCANRW